METAVLDAYRPADPFEVWDVPDLHLPGVVGEGVAFDSLPIDVQSLYLFAQPVGLAIDPAAKVAFRGGWTCGCVATSLPLVERDMLEQGLIKQNIDIYQLGYRTDVSQSAGTHAKGMMVDVGQYSPAQLAVWWKWGWAMQHRTPAQGFIHHGHGGPRGCTHGAPLAMWQMDAYLDGRNGLTSNGPAAGPGGKLPNFRDAIKRYAADLTEKDDLDMTKEEFRKELTAWAQSGEGKAAIQSAVLGGWLGNQYVSGSKTRKYTVAMALQDTANTVAKLAAKAGLK